MVEIKKYSDTFNIVMVLVGILSFILSLVGVFANIALLCKLAFSDLTFWSYVIYASLTNLFLLFTIFMTVTALGHTLGQLDLEERSKNEKRS